MMTPMLVKRALLWLKNPKTKATIEIVVATLALLQAIHKLRDATDKAHEEGWEE